MPALTPTFLWDLESRMRYLVEDEYKRLNNETWWRLMAKVFTSENKRERMSWLLSTMKIERNGFGGNIPFEDMIALTTEFTNLNAAAGLKMPRNELEDLDANGIDVAAKWASDTGAYAAYWPQKVLAEAVLAGEAATSLAYDGQIYFSNAHPSNPTDPNSRTFANVFTSSAGSTPATDPNDAIYPGAAPIDPASVTVEEAFDNLQKVIAYVRSIKMPNGQDPRMLVPAQLFVPPSLTARAQQITNARYIAQSTGNGSGGGSGDVEKVIRNWGLADPVEVREFASDPTSWYLGVREMGSSQLGAMVYVDREPFKVTYYTGQGGGTGVDAVLDRAREIEWHVQGRNVVGYGHPYLLFKVKAS